MQPELLLPEGLAVGALVLGGIALVGAHQDPVQGAVVLVLAVVCALTDGAFDALVGMTVHDFYASFLLGSVLVWHQIMKQFRKKLPVLLFFFFCVIYKT